VGGILGALMLSLLTLLFWVLFGRDALKDGQFVMVFLATVPCGAMLGGVAGATRALVRRGVPGSAGWVCLIGGALIASLVFFFVFLWALSGPGWATRLLLGLVHPGIGAPFLWAMALVLWGVRLLRQQ